MLFAARGTGARGKSRSPRPGQCAMATFTLLDGDMVGMNFFRMSIDDTGAVAESMEATAA